MGGGGGGWGVMGTPGLPSYVSAANEDSFLKIYIKENLTLDKFLIKT